MQTIHLLLKFIAQIVRSFIIINVAWIAWPIKCIRASFHSVPLYTYTVHFSTWFSICIFHILFLSLSLSLSLSGPLCAVHMLLSIFWLADISRKCALNQMPLPMQRHIVKNTFIYILNVRFNFKFFFSLFSTLISMHCNMPGASECSFMMERMAFFFQLNYRMNVRQSFIPILRIFVSLSILLLLLSIFVPFIQLSNKEYFNVCSILFIFSHFSIVFHKGWVLN